MKSQGFSSKHMLLSDARKQGITLPDKLSLWGSFDNFDILLDKHYTPKVFLLFYFEEPVAGLIYLEKTYCKLFKLGFSPHPNQSIPYAHIYVKQQESQRATEQLLSQFITGITQFVKKEFVSFTLVLPPEFQDVREFFWEKWEIVPRFTYYLSLEEIKHIGLSVFVGKKIRNIIKTAKLHLQIKSISANDFYICYHHTYLRQHKKTPKTLSFFKQLSGLPNVHFYGAFQEKSLTSGIIVCEVGDTAFFVTSGAPDDYHNSNGVTYLLYDYFERKLVDKQSSNVNYFDLVGANSKRLSLFKTNFQPKLKVYFLVSKKNLFVKILKKIAYI